jgi:hypothetical protein
MSLVTPLRELNKEQRAQAFVLYEEKFRKIAEENSKFKPKPIKSSPYVIGDDLPGGIHGMVSHADGKKYDSKSKYLAEVKARRCSVVGNEWNNAEYKTPMERGVKGDFNVRPQLKEAVQKVLG